MTVEVFNPPQTDDAIRAPLEALRSRIRRYVWIDGLAAGAVWLGLAFWLSLAVDWFFEPPAAVRAGLLIGTLVILGGVLWELVGRRAFVHLGDSSMALLLERRFPHLQESLLTAVELGPSDETGTGSEPIEPDRDPRNADEAAIPVSAGRWHSEMLAHTRRRAAERAAGLSVAAVLNPRPLRRRIAAAIFLLAAVAALAVAWPHVAGVWTRRCLLMADELWPRRARLAVDGFPGGVAKVARGGDLEIVARADTSMPLVPQVVHIRYRMEGGARGRLAMTRIGAAEPGKDPFQEFSYTFRGLLTPVRLDVLGGDDAVRDLRIEVVDSPTLEMSIKCEYPKYTRLAPRQMPVTGTMPIPRGSRVTVLGRANKDLVRIQVASVQEQPASPPEVMEPAADRRSFAYAIERLDKDATLAFSLLDADGIRSREPVRLALAALPDEPPRLSVQLRGIGPAITPKARLPVAGRVADDYGIARAWFEAVVDQQAPVEQAVPVPGDRPTEVAVDDALEVEPLGIAPGRKLLASLKAADGCDLAGEPNVGSSERWLLDVVSPEQLRAMLDARELVLRQRFEAIVHEVAETGDLLARFDALRVERAMQNGRKNAHETLGVSEAFDDIRLQLVNNRIDTEELIGRLQSGIATPLRDIAERMFPELERRLEGLRAVLEDQEAAVAKRDHAQEQNDAILAAMKEVLNRMLELENFNEAVELLRQIIQHQEKLNHQTKERQKQKLRDLR